MQNTYMVKSINRIQLNVEERFSGRIYIGKEIKNILKLSPGNTLFIVDDEKGNIIIRNKLIVGENLIGTSILRKTADKFYFAISKAIMDKLSLTIDTDILMILDEKGTVILKNPFLLGKCVKEVLHKRGDIGAIVIGLGTVSPKMETTIPVDIRDILEIDDIDEILIFVDKYYNVIISPTTLDHIRLDSAKVYQGRRIYLTRIVMGVLDVNIGDYILWLIDENENIMMRNSSLPIACFEKT